MRLNLLLACAVVAGVIGVSVFAQSDDGLFPETDATIPFGDFEQDEALDSAPSDDDEKLDASEEQKLRQQYLELIEQKSVHMDRSALREAISRTEKDIDELKADAKLQEAKQMLLDLVKTHPETTAAQSARRMLQAEVVKGSILPFEPVPTPYDPVDDGGEFEPYSGLFPATGNEEASSFEAPVNSRPKKRRSGGDVFPEPVFYDEPSPFKDRD